MFLVNRVGVIQMCRLGGRKNLLGIADNVDDTEVHPHYTH